MSTAVIATSTAATIGCPYSQGENENAPVHAPQLINWVYFSAHFRGMQQLNISREQQTAAAYVAQSDPPPRSEHPQQTPISKRSMLQLIRELMIYDDIEEGRLESLSSGTATSILRH